MDDQLHATSFIKEAFGNDGLLCGNGTEHGASLQYVFDCLLGAGIVQPAFLFEPGNRFSHFGLSRREAYRENFRQPIANLLT